MPQQKANAYACFIYEKMNQHRGMNFQQAQEKFAGVFKALPASERERYKNMAKKQNGMIKKQTSTGEYVEDVQRKQRELEQAEAGMRANTEQIISTAIADGTITEKKFYVMHIHYYCFRDGKYYPAEIGAIRFSLNNGIEKQYHKIVHTGGLPLGSSHDANTHSNETHQLPVPSADKNNINETIAELTEFLMENNDRLPVFFAREEGFREKNTEVVENVLEDWFPEKLRVYSVEYFFFQLKKQLMGSAAFPTINLATHEFNRDLYEFTSNLYCGYHEYSEVPHKCSLSIAGRLVYTICDNVCASQGIELIPGFHLPKQARAPIRTYALSSAASTTTSYCMDQSDIESDLPFYTDTDTETVVDNDEGWNTQHSRRRREHYANYSNQSNMSQASTGSHNFSQDNVGSQSSVGHSLRRPRDPVLTSDVASLPIESLSLSQYSDTSNASSIGLRRPFNGQNPLSAVGGPAPRIGRGRGRGIFQATNPGNQ